MKVIYWSDYACPYCYIGETHLKKAIEELGIGDQVEIEMKAFELDEQASREYVGPTVDRFARKYGLSKAGAQARIEGISQMGHEAGLDFRYAETRYTNTFDAHRLTKLAQSKGNAEQTDRLIERLYHAYFAESLELADHAVLAKIAVEEGLPEDEVRKVLESDDYGMEVRLDEREAHRYGVSGVPFFVLGGSYTIPGALPVESMKQVLQELMEKEKSASAQPEGMHCGPDGCTFGG